jgi:bifunctional DNA-binding transcriptional regulator/antitoxin component of YhaV-PrlF toxin-antitoxin module
MPESAALKMGQRGVVTLPKELREQYHLEAGDDLTLLDLGGAFVLSPRRSEVDALADRLSSTLARKGESLQGMLKVVREEREKYGRKS